MPKPMQGLLPLLGVALLTIGCNNNSPPRGVNIVDFTHPADQKPWKPEQMFSDPGLVAMARAIQEGDIDSIRQSLANNLPIEGIGKAGVTPLAWAYMVRNKSAFRYLLEQNADPNIYIFNITFLYILARDKKIPSGWSSHSDIEAIRTLSIEATILFSANKLRFTGRSKAGEKRTSTC